MRMLASSRGKIAALLTAASVTCQAVEPRKPMNTGTAALPTNALANEKSPYLLQHKHNPVQWYPWGEEAFAKARPGEQADLSQRRLLDLPLVPRDGARVFRERGDREDHERVLREHQSGPRGAAGCGPRLHDLCPGDERRRRLADERFHDAGSEAIPRRHLLPASGQIRPPRDSHRAAEDRRTRGKRIERHHGARRHRHRTAPAVCRKRSTGS
jgi:hypothetical protein